MALQSRHPCTDRCVLCVSNPENRGRVHQQLMMVYAFGCVWVCVLPHTRRLHRHLVSTMPSFQVHSIDCDIIPPGMVGGGRAEREGRVAKPIFFIRVREHIQSFQLM